MGSTGIIRRVDDLGRVVIPREIRRTLRITDGQPLEIFIDVKDGSVTFRKYDFLESSRAAIQSTMEFISNDEEINNYYNFGSGGPEQWLRK